MKLLILRDDGTIAGSVEGLEFFNLEKPLGQIALLAAVKTAIEENPPTLALRRVPEPVMKGCPND